MDNLENGRYFYKYAAFLAKPKSKNNFGHKTSSLLDQTLQKTCFKIKIVNKNLHEVDFIKEKNINMLVLHRSLLNLPNKISPTTFIDNKKSLIEVTLFKSHRLQKKSWQISPGIEHNLCYFHAQIKGLINASFLYWILVDDTENPIKGDFINRRYE